MDKDEDRGEVYCKVKVRREGGEHKGGKNQEDKGKGDGIFPGCGGE